MRALYTLAASLGYPTRALSRPSLAPFWPLLTPFSTTLTRPYFDTYGPLQTLSLLCNSLKASSGTLTVSTSTLITFTCTLTDYRGLLEAMRVLLEAVIVLLEAVRVFAGAFVMSTIETKPKRFDVFQNLKWNVSIYSKNFGTKPKLFDLFQFLFCKSKTLLFNPKNFEQNQNVLI